MIKNKGSKRLKKLKNNGSFFKILITVISIFEHCESNSKNIAKIMLQ